eukprot:5508755-Alexandrium_andersonii.AAC.1
MDPDGRGGDRSRSPTLRGPPARPEAPSAPRGSTEPERGPGTHLDTRVFTHMNREGTGGPGAPPSPHADQHPNRLGLRPVGHRGPDGA